MSKWLNEPAVSLVNKSYHTFANSVYPRKKGDDYPTIDTRCMDGLLYFFDINGTVVDPCVSTKSGIIDYLKDKGISAFPLFDALGGIFGADWIITNPPYTRGLVDIIVSRQIMRIQDGEVKNVAMLLREGFAFAQSRKNLFLSPLYDGEIKLCFRPRWFPKKPGDESPIHNFSWHIWHNAGIHEPAEKFYYPPSV